MKISLKKSIRFNKNYFIISLFLLFIEILIGVYAHDDFIRPYAGDFGVVILLYCMVRTFLKSPARWVGCLVLLFAYFVEWTQYEKLADHLHLAAHSIARILLGDYFTWIDIICYTLGILTVLTFEKLIHAKTQSVNSLPGMQRF